MARYEYHSMIDFENDPPVVGRDPLVLYDSEFDENGRKILRAAFRVAESAHFHQSRDKVASWVPYLSHPIMVYEIMRRMGENDPVVLAAALLHDALEDHSGYRANDSGMGDDLMEQLFREGFTEELRDSDMTPQNLLKSQHAEIGGEAYNITNRVMQLCREVTNDEAYGHDGIKENYQIDRAMHMSMDAKRIKLADQAASLVCNLTMENDQRKFGHKQELAFAEKAHALGIAIVDSVKKHGDPSGEPRDLRTHAEYDRENAELAPWKNFYEHALWHVQRLLRAHSPEAREQLRDEFSFDTLFVPWPEQIDMMPKKQRVNETLYMSAHPAKSEAGDALPSGVTEVYLDGEGGVVGYMLWSDLRHAHADANATQKRLTKEVRHMRRISGRDMGEYGGLVQDILQPGEVMQHTHWNGNVMDGKGRVFHLMPAMPAEAFAAAAWNVGAITMADKNVIANTGRMMKDPSFDKPEEKPRPTFKGRWHD